jgi:hypothetical protein
MTNIAAFNLEGLNALAFNGHVSRTTSIGSSQPTVRSAPWRVADGLRQQGFQPGDKVAFLGYTFDAGWARLARVRIVAEMFPYNPDEFWTADASAQAEAINAFAGTGAKAIVAEYVPSDAAANGWQRVENTSFYVYVMSR